MIKISAQKGPFSLQIDFKNHNIMFVAIPGDDTYQCQMKVFMNDIVDVSDQYLADGYEMNGENLYKVMKMIDEKND